MTITSSFKAFFLGCICILLLSWWSSVQGLAWLNLKVHDLALSWPGAKVQNPSTLLINSDLNDSPDFETELNRLIELLQSQHAKEIVLLSRSPQMFKLLGKVEQSIYLATPPPLVDIQNPALKPLKLLGLVAREGIYRQFTQPDTKLSLYSLFDTSAQLRPAPLNFNFFLDVSTLPNLPMSQALAGSLIEELVADKVILIDLDHQYTLTPLFVPPINGVDTASLGQLQVLGVETLLSGSHIRLLSIWAVVIVLLLTYSLYFFTLQLLSPRAILLFVAVMVVATISMSMILLVNWFILLPATELVIAQCFCVIYLLAIERLREESMILKISADLNARLSKKVQPPSFYQSDNPWDNLHALINQQLSLHRSIFLSKVPKDHRVKAIHALNCSIDDIQEMRRDYQRKPYSEAIATQKPIKLSKSYFSSVSDDEVEYMAPLIFSGKVLGFWALTVKPDERFNAAVFENNLVHFSREITELLFHRHRYLQQARKDSNIFRRILTLKLAEAEYQVLDTSVSMLEKRLDSLQYIFDGMSTASALYNLFGQIVHSNKHMEEIVRQLQLPIYSLSAHDFLLQLCNLDSQQVKQRLLQVTLHNVEVSLKIKHAKLQGDFILRIRPIEVANDNKQEGIPFLLLGLLFEFIDISEAQQIISMKKDLYSQYFHQMRNNLSTLNLISRQLSQQIDPQKQQFIGMLDQTLNECTKVNLMIEEQLARQRSLSSQVVPVNPHSELQLVLEKLADQLSNKQIKLALEAPAIISLIMAEPSQLMGLYKQLCELLIDDADSNESTLSIKLSDTVDQDEQREIRMVFINEGYGVPQEHLARLLATDRTELGSGDQRLEKLLHMADNAAYWGLKMTINSTLGDGYVIELVIPVFKIN